MKNTFMVAIFMVVTFLSYGQKTYYIIDATTILPVAGAEIRDSLSHTLVVKSNNRGEVSLSVDGVVLTFSHPEYQTLSFKTISLEKNIIYVWPSSLRLDEVVISAGKFEEKKKDVVNQVHIISARDIAFRNTPTTADLIQSTGEVMVQKSQQGGGSPVLRGFETNKLLLVVDGVRLNNAIYRGGHLQNVITVDNAMLDKAEIVFGPGSVIYGSDALGGVIHMHTKNPVLSDTIDGVLFTGQAYARYASASNENSVHAHVSAGGRKLASLTSFTYSDFGDLRQGNVRNPLYGNWGMREWYVERINNTDSLISNSNAVHEPDVDVNIQKFSGYKQYDLLQKILYKRNNRVSHLLNVQYSTSSNIPRYDRLTQWKNGAPRFAEWYYGPQKRLLAAYNLLLSGNKKLYSHARIILSYQQIEESRFDRAYKNDWLNSQVENVSVYALNADFEKEIGAMEIRYGTEISRNEVSSNANTENISTGEIQPAATRYPNGGSYMQWASAYVTAQYEAGQHHVFSVGARFNSVQLNSDFTDTTFFNFPFSNVSQKNNSISGTLGWVWLPGADWKISTCAASGYRVPNVDDIGKVFESVPGMLLMPNNNIKPEYTYTADLGIEKTIRKKFMISVNGFYTWYKNAITSVASTYQGNDSVLFGGSLSKVITLANTASAHLYGGTARITADITDNLTFLSTLTYTYGRINTDSSDYPLDHIPPLFGKTSVLLNLKKVKAEFFLMYSGWKRLEDYNLVGEDNISNATPFGMPSWLTLNARISYQIIPNASVQVGLDNILDQNYRVFASNISAPGRNLIVTLRANW
ncbi:MAG: TonB-dependent receptor plug domain-containing protein [Flavobacteriales bacterium]